MRRVGLTLIAVAIIADCITTWWQLSHGAHEVGAINRYMFVYTGMYAGMLIASTIKIGVVRFLDRFLRTETKAGLVYIGVAAACWYAPAHNLLLA